MAQNYEIRPTHPHNTSTPMNTDKIRKALESAAARIGCPPGDNADADIYRDIMEAIAELDKANALTDEEIERMAKSFGEGRNMAGSDMALESMTAWEMGARHARDNSYLAPSAGNGLSVDEVMDCMEEAGDIPDNSDHHWQWIGKVRARLEAKSKQP